MIKRKNQQLITALINLSGVIIMTINNSNTFNVLTVKQVPKKYEAFTEGSIRHLIFYADKNGFHKCIRRIGSKVLIIEHLFLEYIDAQKSGGNHAA